MIYKAFKDLELSMLGLGNMRLPTVGEKGPIDREKAKEIIEKAYHSGINYFDTAYRYHGGESESFVGEVLSQFPRDTWYLASKMPGHMMYYKDGKLGFQGYLSDFKCDSIADIFEEQLKKCRVDYFDFYLLHNVCESSYEFYTNEELGVVNYLLEQKAKGKIRHLGFSAHGRAETIDSFIENFDKDTFEFVQIQLNYLDWALQDAKSKYDVITKHGLPVVVMEPVRGGRLVNLSDENEKLLRAARPDESNAAWAFRFLQALPNVQVVLSGMTTLEQLNENLVTFSEMKAVTADEQKTLDAVVDSMLNLVPCTGCRYCTEECPMGLNIPKLIAIYNEINNGGAMLRFNLDVQKDDENPSRCISCGACSRICPQSINIPDIMQKLTESI